MNKLVTLDFNKLELLVTAAFQAGHNNAMDMAYPDVGMNLTVPPADQCKQLMVDAGLDPDKVTATGRTKANFPIQMSATWLDEEEYNDDNNPAF